jgi:hypothetical protein
VPEERQWSALQRVGLRLVRPLLDLYAIVFAVRLNSLRAAVRPIYIDMGIMPWRED